MIQSTMGKVLSHPVWYVQTVDDLSTVFTAAYNINSMLHYTSVFFSSAVLILHVVLVLV